MQTTNGPTDFNNISDIPFVNFLTLKYLNMTKNRNNVLHYNSVNIPNYAFVLLHVIGI